MHTPCLRAVALAGETGGGASGVGDRSPRWRAESRRLIPTGRGPETPGRQPRLTTSTYLCNTNVPFSHPSGVSGQKDGKKVRSRWEGTFTFRRAPLGHPDTVPGRAPARHLRLALHLHAIDACFCAASARVMLIQGSSRDSSDRPTADSAALHGPQGGGLVDRAIVTTAAPQRLRSAAAPQRRRRSRGRDAGDLISSVCRARTNLGADTDHRPDHRKAPG